MSSVLLLSNDKCGCNGSGHEAHPSEYAVQPSPVPKTEQPPVVDLSGPASGNTQIIEAIFQETEVDTMPAIVTSVSVQTGSDQSVSRSIDKQRIPTVTYSPRDQDIYNPAYLS